MRILNKILDFNKKFETHKCYLCNGTGEIKEHYEVSVGAEIFILIVLLLFGTCISGLESQVFYKFLIGLIGLIVLIILLIGIIYEYKKQVGERI